ncbi:hypothetical protein L6452_06728 [Arctium lappa]|uniref:Uncharacterized protein n=1 Tax=Arctium lappa TaxID=4217 RepID=A0ACB9EL06_ARCLA|nr:hypothetical protein L6452_06728 [Arctium lappa]
MNMRRMARAGFKPKARTTRARYFWAEANARPVRFYEGRTHGPCALSRNFLLFPLQPFCLIPLERHIFLEILLTDILLSFSSFKSPFGCLEALSTFSFYFLLFSKNPFISLDFTLQIVLKERKTHSSVFLLILSSKD